MNWMKFYIIQGQLTPDSKTINEADFLAHYKRFHCMNDKWRCSVHILFEAALYNQDKCESHAEFIDNEMCMHKRVYLVGEDTVKAVRTMYVECLRSPQIASER